MAQKPSIYAEELEGPRVRKKFLGNFHSGRSDSAGELFTQTRSQQTSQDRLVFERVCAQHPLAAACK